ncbi:BaiN/RdsA family NAD(P)/FAD-dependent oxidoreductase [Lichenicola cladoniae]|nr:NAD(P)/FAD-dependent oxidoreductase [Lichenicola cladoniae]
MASDWSAIMGDPRRFDVAILGAGAAGLMAAIAAGRRGRSVLLLDHAEEPGAKIVISGGGRCNFTNRDCKPDRFQSQNPHFARSALARYTSADFLALVEKHKIVWHEKTLGQLFCDGSARQIVAMLLAECEAAGVTLRTGQRITDISRPDRFRLMTDEGAVEADSLIVATGGLSIPKMGATGFAYDIARRFDVPIVPTMPALVPFTFGDEQPAMRTLAGVSLEVMARCGGASFREAMLFTHRGLSGPSMLQVSSYWREDQQIHVDLAPGQDLAALFRQRRQTRGKAELQTILGEFMPLRLAQAVTLEQGASGPFGGLNQVTLNAVIERLKDWRLSPTGTEGYAKAEVTGGGIDTKALSSKTMAVTAVPGLFFIGEAVDVTGWLGGYNFQWAWSSGWAAGMAA